jgi:hypothetical protein
MLRLNPPIPVRVLHGETWTRATAHALIDYGSEQDLVWVCFLDEGPAVGECWSALNSRIRARENVTAGRVIPIGTSPSDDPEVRTYNTDPPSFDINLRGTTFRWRDGRWSILQKSVEPKW